MLLLATRLTGGSTFSFTGSMPPLFHDAMTHLLITSEQLSSEPRRRK